VLGPLHFAFEAGETVAVIGRSGCGKSTLLRLVAGLDTPSAGTATLAGQPIRPEDVAIVFQEPRLMPWLSVADNVGFGLGHLSKIARADAVAEALDVVGLAEAATKLPKQLSGGMAQRTALARALVVRPQLLLLDEPFSALDPLTRVGLQNHLGEVRDHYGPTVLLITHACKVETGRALAVAGLHPATGGSGLELCSGDMLLEALVACAGVTLKSVATAIEIPLKSGT
jgi:sulfonate transport system ATP-binding protein